MYSVKTKPFCIHIADRVEKLHLGSSAAISPGGSSCDTKTLQITSMLCVYTHSIDGRDTLDVFLDNQFANFRLHGSFEAALGSLSFCICETFTCCSASSMRCRGYCFHRSPDVGRLRDTGSAIFTTVTKMFRYRAATFNIAGHSVSLLCVTGALPRTFHLVAFMMGAPVLNVLPLQSLTVPIFDRKPVTVPSIRNGKSIMLTPF